MTIPHHLSDRYELGEILGLGGMSEVHHARDTRLNRDVAVKVLRTDLARDPSFYLRFRREPQHAAALNHPMIVAIYDTGEAETATGPLPYIVMEYVDGLTLRDTVSRDGPMEPSQAIEVIADACQALDFSHRQGIVHRDVKPANIMIDTAGSVKVMDFGIARTLADTTGAGRLTQTAAVLGTASYLSPEQASGENVDARSDVYSLGCVLYELLTGAPPFVSDTPIAVAYQHVRKDPVPPSRRHKGVSTELDAVVLKALAKNPENRYQSAAAMRTDLIRVHSGQTPEAPKVFTDADRTDLLGSAAPGGEREELAGGARGRGGPDGDPVAGRSVRRWLLTAGAIIVLVVVAVVAVNAFIDRAHPVRVPDLHGQDLQSAVATLQNSGFKIRGPIEKADAAIPVGQVVDTDPGADTALAGGDEVTINVSSGPERHRVPDCSTVSADTCVRRLADAGFDRPQTSSVPSPTVPERLVVATIPAGGQLVAVTADITIEVSAGPETRRVPDLTGQTVDQATTNLKIAGFPIVVTVQADSLLPTGQVVATDPSAGVDLSVRSAVTVKVSRDNRFPMPNLIDKTYVEVMPMLQGYGYVGQLINGGAVPGPDANRFRVVAQDPPAGAGVNRDGTITLNYGS